MKMGENETVVGLLRLINGSPDFAVCAMYWPWPDGGWMAGCVLLDKDFAVEQNLKAMYLPEDFKGKWNPFDGFENGLNVHASNEKDAVRKLWKALEELPCKKDAP